MRLIAPLANELAHRSPGRPRPAAGWRPLGRHRGPAYALDAVASPAGARSPARPPAGRAALALLGVLAPSYVLWGAGAAGVNLRANWAFFRSPAPAPTRCRRSRTTSRRSAPRKRGRDGSRARRGTWAPRSPRRCRTRRRVRRGARCDTVSSGDAIVFLAGANLGAAAYEYGLGRLTAGVPARGRGPSRRTGCRRNASRTTTAVVEPDEVAGIAFFVAAMRDGRARPAGAALRDRADAASRVPRPPAARRRSTSPTTCRRTSPRSTAGCGAPRRPRLAPVHATQLRCEAPPRPTEAADRRA